MGAMWTKSTYRYEISDNMNRQEVPSGPVPSSFGSLPLSPWTRILRSRLARAVELRHLVVGVPRAAVGLLPLAVGQEAAAPAEVGEDEVTKAAPVMPPAQAPAITARRPVALRR